MQYLPIAAVLAQDVANGLDLPLGSAYNLCSAEQAGWGEACYAVNLPGEFTPLLATLYVRTENEWVLACPAALRPNVEGTWEQLQPHLAGAEVLCAQPSDHAHHQQQAGADA